MTDARIELSSLANLHAVPEGQFGDRERRVGRRAVFQRTAAPISFLVLGLSAGEEETIVANVHSEWRKCLRLMNPMRSGNQFPRRHLTATWSWPLSITKACMRFRSAVGSQPTVGSTRYPSSRFSSFDLRTGGNRRRARKRVLKPALWPRMRLSAALFPISLVSSRAVLVRGMGMPRLCEKRY